MPGIFNFAISLLVLLLIALANLRQSRSLMNLAFIGMITDCLIGWYQYIFSAGLGTVFIAGTIATVAIVSGFFYAIYSTEIAWVEESQRN